MEKCQLDHIFQDFLEPYKKSAILVTGLRAGTTAEELVHITSSPAKPLSSKIFVKSDIEKFSGNACAQKVLSSHSMLGLLVYSSRDEACDVYEEMRHTLVRLGDSGSDRYMDLRLSRTATAVSGDNISGLNECSEFVIRYVQQLEKTAKPQPPALSHNYTTVLVIPPPFKSPAKFLSSLKSLFQICTSNTAFHTHIRYLSHSRNQTFWRYGIALFKTPEAADAALEKCRSAYPKAVLAKIDSQEAFLEHRKSMKCPPFRWMANDSGAMKISESAYLNRIQNENSCEVTAPAEPAQTTFIQGMRLQMTKADLNFIAAQLDRLRRDDPPISPLTRCSCILVKNVHQHMIPAKIGHMFTDFGDFTGFYELHEQQILRPSNPLCKFGKRDILLFLRKSENRPIESSGRVVGVDEILFSCFCDGEEVSSRLDAEYVKIESIGEQVVEKMVVGVALELCVAYCVEFDVMDMGRLGQRLDGVSGVVGWHVRHGGFGAYAVVTFKNRDAKNAALTDESLKLIDTRQNLYDHMRAQHDPLNPRVYRTLLPSTESYIATDELITRVQMEADCEIKVQPCLYESPLAKSTDLTKEETKPAEAKEKTASHLDLVITQADGKADHAKAILKKHLVSMLKKITYVPENQNPIEILSDEDMPKTPEAVSDAEDDPPSGETPPLEISSDHEPEPQNSPTLDSQPSKEEVEMGEKMLQMLENADRSSRDSSRCPSRSAERAPDEIIELDSGSEEETPARKSSPKSADKHTLDPWKLDLRDKQHMMRDMLDACDALKQACVAFTEAQTRKLATDDYMKMWHKKLLIFLKKCTGTVGRFRNLIKRIDVMLRMKEKHLYKRKHIKSVPKELQPDSSIVETMHQSMFSRPFIRKVLSLSKNSHMIKQADDRHPKGSVSTRPDLSKKLLLCRKIIHALNILSSETPGINPRNSAILSAYGPKLGYFEKLATGLEEVLSQTSHIKAARFRVPSGLVDYDRESFATESSFVDKVWEEIIEQNMPTRERLQRRLTEVKEELDIMEMAKHADEAHEERDSRQRITKRLEVEKEILRSMSHKIKSGQSVIWYLVGKERHLDKDRLSKGHYIPEYIANHGGDFGTRSRRNVIHHSASYYAEIGEIMQLYFQSIENYNPELALSTIDLLNDLRNTEATAEQMAAAEKVLDEAKKDKKKKKKSKRKLGRKSGKPVVDSSEDSDDPEAAQYLGEPPKKKTLISAEAAMGGWVSFTADSPAAVERKEPEVITLTNPTRVDDELDKINKKLADWRKKHKLKKPERKIAVDYPKVKLSSAQPIATTDTSASKSLVSLNESDDEKPIVKSTAPPIAVEDMGEFIEKVKAISSDWTKEIQSSIDDTEATAYSSELGQAKTAYSKWDTLRQLPRSSSEQDRSRPIAHVQPQRQTTQSPTEEDHDSDSPSCLIPMRRSISSRYDDLGDGEQPVSNRVDGENNTMIAAHIKCIEGYFKGIHDKMWAEINGKLVMLYQRQQYCQVLRHRVYYRGTGQKLMASVASGILLTIHSPTFSNISTMEIALPIELDPTGITSVLDYLHGFQLQKPPERHVDELYAAASYFQLHDLQTSIVRSFGHKVTASHFSQIRDFVLTLPPPLCLPAGTKIYDVTQLPSRHK